MCITIGSPYGSTSPITTNEDTGKKWKNDYWQEINKCFE